MNFKKLKSHWALQRPVTKQNHFPSKGKWLPILYHLSVKRTSGLQKCYTEE